MNAKPILTAMLAGLACAQALAAEPAKPTAKPPPKPAVAASPWAKVPALPTACYSNQDPWYDKNNAAIAVVQQDRYKQEEINSAIRQNSIDNDDPMAMAARLQQKMMDDPANAQKYMQQMMQQNQQAQEETPAQLEREQQIEAESGTVMKQYEAALKQASAAGNARRAALEKRLKLKPGEAGNMWMRMGDPGDPDWVLAERQAILKEWDRAYLSTCAQWWSATGPIHAYMKRYRDFLVLERIPFEKQADKARLDQYEMMGIPHAGWKTTTEFEAAEDYMAMANKLFSQRSIDPWCRALEHCQ